VAGGVWWWGFEKLMADITQQGDLYSVRGYFLHEDLISLRTGTSGPKGHLADFPNLIPIANMISQPMVTKAFARLGPWVASSFDWGWDQADIWSIDASMKILEQFLPALSTGTTEFTGIAQAPLGTFRIRTNWTLSLPYSPNELSPGQSLAGRAATP